MIFLEFQIFPLFFGISYILEHPRHSFLVGLTHQKKWLDMGLILLVSSFKCCDGKLRSQEESVFLIISIPADFVFLVIKLKFIPPFTEVRKDLPNGNV